MTAQLTKFFKKPRNPLIVLDWNIIQSVTLDAFRATEDVGFLIADEVIQEVLQKPDDGKVVASQQLRRFFTFCKIIRERSWSAIPTNCFTFYSRPINVDRLISQGGTRFLRSFSIRQEADFSEIVSYGRSTDPSRDFMKRCLEFTKMISEYRSVFQVAGYIDANIVNDLDACTKIVREAGLLKHAMREEDKRRLSITDAQLANFPNALACCRWMRLACWYCFRHAQTNDTRKSAQRMANDFADANYAFLGSYTGHLASNDIKCQQAARAICPHLQIWNWDVERKMLFRKKT